MTEKKPRKAKVKEVDILKQKLEMYLQMPEQIKVINKWTEKDLQREVGELENLIELSNRGKASRRKGASYENIVAKKIKEKLNITLVRTPLSGGFQKSADTDMFKGDLNCIDPNTRFLLHPECKNHKAWSVGAWWKQTVEDCSPDKMPMLVMHRNQKIKDGKRVETAEDFVMLKLSDFLNIVDKDKIIEVKGDKKDGTSKGKIGTGKAVKRGIKRPRKQDI